MTASNRIFRTLAMAAAGLLTAGVGQAQTWDMDACTGGTKSASGYTNCGTGTAAHGTLNITAYSSSSATSNFTTASTSINNGGSYLGVWSGNENQSSDPNSDNSPHHSIDNVTAYGSAYELVHLQFSKAVDLGTLVANWSYSDGDFQVFRWNYDAATPDPTITDFNPNEFPTGSTASNGWKLVKSGDFSYNKTQIISDASYFSSHWLVTTAFGGTNDGFKLGTITAYSVCTTSQTSTGGCAPPSTSVPEPATLAMVLLAGVGATVTRRRRA